MSGYEGQPNTCKTQWGSERLRTCAPSSTERGVAPHELFHDLLRKHSFLTASFRRHCRHPWETVSGCTEGLPVWNSIVWGDTRLTLFMSLELSRLFRFAPFWCVALPEGRSSRASSVLHELLWTFFPNNPVWGQSCPTLEQWKKKGVQSVSSSQLPPGTHFPGPAPRSHPETTTDFFKAWVWELKKTKQTCYHGKKTRSLIHSSGLGCLTQEGMGTWDGPLKLLRSQFPHLQPGECSTAKREAHGVSPAFFTPQPCTTNFKKENK